MWLDKRKNLSTSGGRLRKTDKRPHGRRRSSNPDPRTSPPACYTVAEVAEILHVTKSTVMTWLDYDEGDPASAVIHPDLWFKLPNGHIRIRQAAVDQLLGTTES
jgi:hypothetical protein